MELCKLNNINEYFNNLDDYYLTYRNTLNLPYYIQFGMELEYEECLKTLTSMFIKKNLSNWISDEDASLRSGGEVISPIMHDTVKCWDELEKICAFLLRHGANTEEKAGGHIHIGANALGDNIDDWRRFLKLYTAYESILYRFAEGDKVGLRRRGRYYAMPVADLIKNKLNAIDDVEDVSMLAAFLPNHNKYLALSFLHTTFEDINNVDIKNTLEFRMPNASTNPIIWQNNLNTFAKMILSSKYVNEDFLDYKLKSEYISYITDPYAYSTINLKDALEFTDIVFTDDLDKMYFLKQYLKDYQNSYGTTKGVKCKKFTRW